MPVHFTRLPHSVHPSAQSHPLHLLTSFITYPNFYYISNPLLLVRCSDEIHLAFVVRNFKILAIVNLPSVQVLPIKGLTDAAVTCTSDGSVISSSGMDGSIHLLQPLPLRQQAESMAAFGELQEALRLASFIPESQVTQPILPPDDVFSCHRHCLCATVASHWPEGWTQHLMLPEFRSEQSTLSQL